MSQIEDRVEALLDDKKEVKLRSGYRFRILMSLFLLTLVVGLSFFTLRPPTYTARAWFQILSSRPFFVYSEENSREYNSFVNTQFALIRSPIILEKALESPEVARLPSVAAQRDKVAWLSKKLKLQRQGQSEMATVSLTLPRRDEPDKIVNAVVNAFFEYYDSQSQDWTTKLINQLTLELHRQKALARQLQTEIRENLEYAARTETSRASQTGNITTPGEAILKDIYAGESRLEEYRAELQALNEAKKKLAARVTSDLVETALAGDPELRKLKERKQQSQILLTTLRKTLPRADAPEILAAEQSIQELTVEIEALQESLTEAKTEEMIRQLTRMHDEQIWAKEMMVRTTEILIENLQTRYRTQLATTGHQTTSLDRTADLSFQQAQLARVMEVQNLLENRVVALQTELHAPAQIQLRKKATPPSAPDRAFSLRTWIDAND